MSRKQSREIAFRLVFGLCFGQTEVLTDEAIELAAQGEPLEGPELEYVKKVCVAVNENLLEIDKFIEERSQDFSFDRIFKTDLTAMRLAIAEVRYVQTPPLPAINEAINLVKKYGSEKSAAFVNGVLAALVEK